MANMTQLRAKCVPFCVTEIVLIMSAREDLGSSDLYEDECNGKSR
jgi:hypothetical protein